MSLHRFFLPPGCFSEGRVTFPSDQSRQMRTVLRLRPGDRVIALDGTGRELIVRLSEVGTAACGTVEEERHGEAEPGIELVLYQGLLKGAKLELVLQKGTEIGVSRFVPVRSERSVPAETSPSRLRRYEAIVREAAEQSRRSRLPLVDPAVAFVDALQQAAHEGPVVMLWEEEQTMHLRDLKMGTHHACLGLFVGPEGGFSAAEAERARDGGAHIVTLGRRILRSETAAIAGSALLLSIMGEFG